MEAADGVTSNYGESSWSSSSQVVHANWVFKWHVALSRIERACFTGQRAIPISHLNLTNRKVVHALVIAKVNMEELSQSRILETVPVGLSDHELVIELKVVADKG
jgi:hypothetical protein